MATGTYFVAENTEIGQAVSFSVRRIGSVTWECKLPLTTLSDAIATLSAAIGAVAPITVRGSVYQAVKEAVPAARPKTKWQWLGIQSPGSLIDLYTDELPDLVATLSALSGEVDEPIDLDLSNPTKISVDLLPMEPIKDAVAEDIPNPDTAIGLALSATFVRFVDENGDPLPAGSITTIHVNTTTGEIDDITFEEA